DLVTPAPLLRQYRPQVAARDGRRADEAAKTERVVRLRVRAGRPGRDRRAKRDRALPPAGAGVSGATHPYVHLPFCAHRCGYCGFVTVVGRHADHGRYVDALSAELELERPALAQRVETIFVGGGTPTFTEPAALERLLAALPDADEVTVEANPE